MEKIEDFRLPKTQFNYEMMGEWDPNSAILEQAFEARNAEPNWMEYIMKLRKANSELVPNQLF